MLCIPAFSAMALMVVRKGPMVLCNSTVASTILLWVSFWRSALRFITYFRAMEEIIAQICAFNLDSRSVCCHCCLHSFVQGKEQARCRPAEEQTFKEHLLNREDVGRRTFAHEPGEGEAWWWVGVLATIKATAEQTDGRYALVGDSLPMATGALHVHHQEDEGFYILEGEMTFYVGEQTTKARPGSYLFGPKDVPCTPSPVDSGPEVFVRFSPAGLEAGIREMGEPARSLTVPPSRMRS